MSVSYKNVRCIKFSIHTHFRLLQFCRIKYLWKNKFENSMNASEDSSVKFFIAVIGTITIAIVLRELQYIFIPLILAYFLFFVFEPLNAFLTRKKIPVSLTTILDLLIVVGIIWGFSRIIVASFSKFGEQLPFYEAKLNNLIRSWALSLQITDPLLVNFNLSEYLKNLNYGGIIGNAFGSTVSFVSGTFFVLLFFLFVNSGHRKILETIKSRASAASGNSALQTESAVEKTFDDITTQIQHYLSVKFYLSLLVALLYAIVLAIFGVDFLVVWVVLAFLLYFIPSIGPFISVILPTLMALVQFESIGTALLILLIIVAFQTIIGNILEPKILGERLGLNPLVILLSLLIWGYIWGVVGMILSVPLTSIFKIIFSRSHSRALNFLSNLMD